LRGASAAPAAIASAPRNASWLVALPVRGSSESAAGGPASTVGASAVPASVVAVVEVSVGGASVVTGVAAVGGVVLVEVVGGVVVVVVLDGGSSTIDTSGEPVAATPACDTENVAATSK